MVMCQTEIKVTKVRDLWRAMTLNSLGREKKNES